ncbi:MAG TPA: PAS domain S-box protein, partial [Armatimonadota bacterium]|nr:PAS domain S-box protein [Armatimonadota bacterium]
MPLDPSLAYDLLLLMLQLTEIQEPRIVKKLFCRAVNALQPYLAVRVLAEGESAEGEVFPISTARRDFGEVAITGDIAKAPSELLPMLHTAVRMLALILEDIEQHQLLAAQNQQLEVTVQQRARALRASEERFRTLFEAVSCGVLVRDSEGLVQHVNPPAATILGLPVEKLQCTPILPDGWRFVHKDGTPVATGDLPSSVALREGRSVRDTLLGLYAPQFPNVRWLLVNVEPQRDPDTGQINRCVTLFIDITEHIATERRQVLATRILQHLNQPGEPMAAIGMILRLIQEHTGTDAVGIRLREGDDYPYYDTSGFSEAFLSRERTLHILSPTGEPLLSENGTPRLACLCGCVLQGRTDPALPFFTPGGSFWTNCASEFASSTALIQCSAAPRNCCAAEGYESVALIPLRSGDEVVGLLHLADRRRDQMTPSRIQFFEGLGASIGVAIARRRAEDARRRAEETLARYQLLAAHTRDIILFARCRDGRIVEANEAALQAYGYTREELLSLTIPTLRDPETEAPAQDSIAEAAPQGTLYETQHRRSDGSSFPAEVSSQPMLLDGEEVLLCIVRDISERVRLEAQLRQAQKMEAIGLLAGGIAHDFNNILTPIMAYSDILLSRIPEGDPALRYVDQIAALAERASGLTQQLLAFSRRQVLQPVVLDLNQVLSELEKMLRRLIGENILLHLKLNPALMPVKADTGQMEQVLMNLV